MALDILKSVDNVYPRGLLQKPSSYRITGKFFSFIKSFLSDMFLKVVANGQSSDAYANNTGVFQVSLPGPTLYFTLMLYLSIYSDIL